MSAIAYFLEREGIATTGISLVRENTVSFAPPRFLWVSFPLGRPLGEPGNAPLQRRVIAHALGLLERNTGPVLDDFPEDVATPLASVDDGHESLVCPVSFGAGSAASFDWQARLRQEVSALLPWYEAGTAARERTTFGIVGAEPLALAEMLGAAVDGGELPSHPIKHVLEDLKAFYNESMLAQPVANAVNLSQWLWMDTELGRAMMALRGHMLDDPEPRTRAQAESLIPRWVVSAYEDN